MNLKEITWQDAEKLEPGSKLWVGQTREKAVELRWNGRSFVNADRNGFALGPLCALNLTPYIPTPDPVDISPSEALARCADNLPVNGRIAWDKESRWEPIRIQRWRAIQSMNALGEWSDCTLDGWEFQIPAIPPAKQKLTIEVDAGVEVPDEFTIFPVEQKLSYLVGELATATVIHREAK